jgi:hypothetical protein
MNINLLIILLATVIVRPYNMPVGPTAVEFTDPGFKGSLIAYDRPRIPEEYRSLWADRKASCAHPESSDSRVRIGTFNIDKRRVVRVETYSDHPAIVVGMRGEPEAWIDIALDGNHISLRRGNGTETKILLRCPDPSGASPAHDEDREAWLNEAHAACKTDDFDLFSDAFLRSADVRRRYVGKQVTLIGPTETRKVSRRFYIRGSLPLRDFSVFATANSREAAGATIGRSGKSPPQLLHRVGWLDFSRRDGCWRLIEDAVAIAGNE